MAYPISSAVTRVRRILEDYPYESRNTSDPGTATAGALDTFDVVDGTKWDEGNLAEFQDNGELCYVVSVSTNTLTVIRGFSGSTTQAHAVDTRLIKDPVFAWQSVLEAWKHSINGLWPHAWKKVEVNFVPSDIQEWYNLTAEFLLLSSVLQISGTGQTVNYYGADGALPVFLRRNLPVTLVASGVGLHLPEGFYHETNSIYVIGLGRILDTTDTTDFLDVENFGVDIECMAFGAAAKLMTGKESLRVSSEDITQADQSVVPLRRAQFGQALMNRHLELRNEWYHYLIETIPPMTRWY